ncbi:hypothetical protein [Methylobacterium sp. Leaf118]|uniref:hypothetical protein n=1 Tax=Methylobacterium sp. Leaf118 TaxID=2876562 RepID=UPI001E2F4BD1|nr:hypothetical protein [Methylobacterium sp. Leaf118]
MNPNVDRVGDILADLVRAALISDDGRSLTFRQAAAERLATLRASPPDPESLRMDGAWTIAVRAAEAPEFRPAEGRVSLTLPQRSPFDLDALLASDFDLEQAVERIRGSASTG